MPNYFQSAFLLLFFCFAACKNPDKTPPVLLPKDLEDLGKIVNTNPDSVQKRLKGIADTLLVQPVVNDPNACKAIFLYSKALFLSGEIDQNFGYSRNGKIYARRAKQPLYEAKFTGQMGYKYLVNARYDSAATYFAESMQLFASIPDSAEYYKSAINWGSTELKARPAAAQQVCSVIRGAVAYYKKNGPPAALVMGRSNLAQCYGEMKMQDSARYYFSLVETSIDLLPVSQKPQVLLNIGIIAEEDGDFEKALRYYKAADALKDANPRIAPLVAFNKGVLLHKLKKMVESEHSLKAALASIPNDSTFMDIRQNTLYELSSLYSDLHQWEKAYLYRQQEEALADTIKGLKTQQHLNKLRTELQVSGQEELISQQKKALFFQNFIVGIFIFLLLGLGYIIQKRKVVYKAEQSEALSLIEKNAVLTQEKESLIQILDEQSLIDSALDKVITLSNRERTQIKVDDILYINAEAGGVSYHTTHGSYFNWESLRQCLTKLPSSQFVQINKNTIVAKNEIIGKTSSSIQLRSGTTFPLGVIYRDNLKEM